jgi:hypothetical protein
MLRIQMEKIIFIAAIKSAVIFFVAFVVIRLDYYRALKLDRRTISISYYTGRRLQHSFQSLGKNIKIDELYPYSVTLDDPVVYREKRMVKKPIRGAFILFALTAILFVLSVLSWTVHDSLVVKGHEFYTWTSTEGKIQNIETRRCEPRYTQLRFCRPRWEVRVNYTFEVDGVTYDNRHNDIFQWERFQNRLEVYTLPTNKQIEYWDGGAEEAAAFQSEYSEDENILIVYDPENPYRNVLQKDINSYVDRPRNVNLRSNAKYGAFLAGLVAGAVVFPAGLNLLFPRRQPRPDTNFNDFDSKELYSKPFKPS